MQKHIKIVILGAIYWGMFVYWAVLIAMNVRDEMINYWWQAFMGAAALLFAVFGIMSAKGWHYTKSSMGKSVLAMSIGLFMWGLGQAVWTIDVIRNPALQSPPGHLLDVLYSSAMVFWAYGIIKLAKASGAKYGFRSVKSKIIAAVIVLVLWSISYGILVDVVRGGLSYFHNSDSFWSKFFDLSYAAGDVINLTMALVIFATSWKYLGGKFKKPIIVMLSAFFVLYMADFWFSYRDGLGVYYNGDWTDLLFMTTVATFGLGLCLLDPSSYRKDAKVSTEALEPIPVAVAPGLSGVTNEAPSPPMPSPDVVPTPQPTPKAVVSSDVTDTTVVPEIPAVPATTEPTVIASPAEQSPAPTTVEAPINPVTPVPEPQPPSEPTVAVQPALAPAPMSVPATTQPVPAQSNQTPAGPEGGPK